MSSISTRVAIQLCLESLPAIQALLRSPVPHLEFAVSRDGDIPEDTADILVMHLDDEAENMAGQLEKIRCVSRNAKVLLMTCDPAAPRCEEAIIHGASGLIELFAPTPVLIKALGCIARGELWLDRQTTGRVFDRLSRGMVRKRRPGSHAWALCIG